MFGSGYLRPLDSDWERSRDESVCKITTELIAALGVDVLIPSFCLDIRSLLRMIILIDGCCKILPRFTAKLASNAPGEESKNGASKSEEDEITGSESGAESSEI